jgi:hypothetical protein
MALSKHWRDTMTNQEILNRYKAIRMIEGYLKDISKIGGKKQAYAWIQDDLEKRSGQFPGITLEMKDAFFEILPKLNGLKLYQKDNVISEEATKYYKMLPKDKFGYAILNAA